MTKYIVNNETDGDGWYHVHIKGSWCAPFTNYTDLYSTILSNAIDEVKRKLNKSNVRGCKWCTK